MNYNKPQTEKTAGVIRYSCGILYMCFCACFLYFIHGDMLTEAQYVYSDGLTHYSIPIGAVIITLILMLIQWVTARFLRFADQYHALTYVPSSVLLALLVDVNEHVLETYSNGSETVNPFSVGILQHWVWLLPLTFIALPALKVFLLSHHDESVSVNGSIERTLLHNYFIILIITIACGAIPSTNKVHYYEQKAERLILERRYAEAALVGKESQATSIRLGSLRSYALSLCGNGNLPEHLFEYNHPYGADEIIDITDTAHYRRITSQHICAHLRSYCGKNISSTLQYLDINVHRDSIFTPKVIDYYLCYLLLDRRISKFREEFKRLYPQSSYFHSSALLPRSYQEALVLGKYFNNCDTTLTHVYNPMSHDMVPSYISPSTLERLNQYRDNKSNSQQHRNTSLYIYNSIGDTYWWYYDRRDDK